MDDGQLARNRQQHSACRSAMPADPRSMTSKHGGIHEMAIARSSYREHLATPREAAVGESPDGTAEGIRTGCYALPSPHFLMPDGSRLIRRNSSQSASSVRRFVENTDRDHLLAEADAHEVPSSRPRTPIPRETSNFRVSTTRRARTQRLDLRSTFIDSPAADCPRAARGIRAGRDDN